MFNSFWVSAFPEVFGNAILIDNVIYIPMETTISTVTTIVILYGMLFGMFFWIGRELLDLCKLFVDLVFSLIKRYIQAKQTVSS